MLELLPREHVGADPNMGAILSKQGLVRGGLFGYFCRCRQKLLAHILMSYYEEMIVLVCENLLNWLTENQLNFGLTGPFPMDSGSETGMTKGGYGPAALCIN